jgi:hypothetical protein
MNGESNAFPLVVGMKPYNGLTKREYLAGLAMQGLMASPGNDFTFEQWATRAVMMADALLAELAK